MSEAIENRSQPGTPGSLQCEREAAVRMRIAAVALELRKAAETADGARESLLKLALRFEQHAIGDNQ